MARLLSNGEYDFFFPVQSTQDPFYQLLGAKKKKHLLYETGHVVPRNELIKETWERDAPAIIARPSSCTKT